MQLLILQTHMEMTLCLSQCDSRPRRWRGAIRLPGCCGRAGVGAATTAPVTTTTAANTTTAASRRGADSGPPPPPASLPVAVTEAVPASPRCPLQWPSLRRWRPCPAARAQARCRQRPCTSAGVTARCCGGSGSSCTCPLLWPSLRRRRWRRRSLPAAGGGRGGAADRLPPPAMPATPMGEATAASSRGTR